MTSVQFALTLAKRRVKMGIFHEEQEKDPAMVRYEIECAMGYLERARQLLDAEDNENVCQYCGEEAEEDHICAMCVKG